MAKYMCGLDEVEKGDFLEPEGNGCLWNDSTIETVKLDGHWYVLNGWNGESYGHCWEIDGPNGFEVIDKNKEHTIIPVDEEVKVAEDGDINIEWETIGYKFGY